MSSHWSSNTPVLVIGLYAYYGMEDIEMAIAVVHQKKLGLKHYVLLYKSNCTQKLLDYLFCGLSCFIAEAASFRNVQDRLAIMPTRQLLVLQLPLLSRGPSRVHPHLVAPLQSPCLVSQHMLLQL